MCLLALCAAAVAFIATLGGVSALGFTLRVGEETCIRFVPTHNSLSLGLFLSHECSFSCRLCMPQSHLHVLFVLSFAFCAYSQDVIRGEYVSGEFWVEPEGRVVAVNVRDPLGAVAFHKPHAFEGNFAYTAADNGEYKACFSNTVDHGTFVTVPQPRR